MAIGTRIKQRLRDLEWQQKDLIDAASKISETPISPQSISNLIRRDSARSEQDEVIAEALGVGLMWLVYGREVDGEFKLISGTHQNPIKAREPMAAYVADKNGEEMVPEDACDDEDHDDQEENQSDLLKELINIAKTMPKKGQIELIGQAKYLAMEYQRQNQPKKRKPGSSGVDRKIRK
jgi:hypothetical protein